MAANQLCGNFCNKEMQPSEWRQHCSIRRNHEVCVNLRPSYPARHLEWVCVNHRPKPQNHPCCGSHHEKSQCKYRANQGKRFTGPETLTTRNSYARRQLSRPPMEEFIESIRNLFDEDDNYLESIRNLFYEEGDGKVTERSEPAVELRHTHNWWEGFKAGPYPRVQSTGMRN